MKRDNERPYFYGLSLNGNDPAFCASPGSLPRFGNIFREGNVFDDETLLFGLNGMRCTYFVRAI